MGASTVLWSNTNIQVRLGASQKVVARRDHLGGVLPLRKQVWHHSAAGKVQLIPIGTP